MIFFSLNDELLFLFHCNKSLKKIEKKGSYTRNSVAMYTDSNNDLSVYEADNCEAILSGVRP